MTTVERQIIMSLVTSIRMQAESLAMLIEGIEARERVESEASAVRVAACTHPKPSQTNITSMGDPFRVFYCGACRTTVTTTEAVGT